MNRLTKLLLFCALAGVLLAGAATAYEFFVGFPRRFEGRRVHRVTVWSADHRFERARVKHGVFRNFENGKLVQQATYRDGKLDGTLTFWNLLGAKTQELYYRGGTPYGWANFAGDKLVSMHQEITQDGRTVAVKNFLDHHYWLEFRCGELMNVAIDPVSGQISSVANASRRDCIPSQAGR
jgi:hypothetical protein